MHFSLYDANSLSPKLFASQQHQMAARLREHFDGEGAKLDASGG